VPERILDALAELERTDEEIGAALNDLDALAAELDSIRSGAAELQAFQRGLPSERERLSAELERARAEATAAQDAMAEAEQAVRTAEPAGAQEAERFLVRARDRLAGAERRAAAAASKRGELENEVNEAAVKGLELQAHARKLAAELGGKSQVADDAGKEPSAGLDGLESWAEVARAALFVARGQLASQRDAVIRQANEIGAAALGEPLTAMGTGALARRVEQGLARGDA